MFRKLFLTSSLFFVCAFVAKGQTVVNASGTTLTGSSAVLEYSIGEIAITTIQSPGNYLTQGLLQPRIRFISAECNKILDSAVYFPNPAQDYITISSNYDGITFYQVFAADGKLVQSDVFTYKPIYVARLARGVYFIRLLTNCNNTYKTIKFVKL